MANLANCCLLLLPCQITRWRRVTYHNPKFAEHPHVPLTHLGGTSRCFAHHNCRAEHVNVPPGPLQQGWRCFAIFGFGTGISPISRTRKAILCRMRRAAVRHLPISAPGAQEEAIWWFLVGIRVRLFGGVALGGTKQERRSDRMVKSPLCGADEARARASAGISRNPRYPPPPKAAAPSGGGGRSFETAAKQETESSQMANLRFCGADEARTRDPRRDRPVF